jgi:hypothetical protein
MFGRSSDKTNPLIPWLAQKTLKPPVPLCSIPRANGGQKSDTVWYHISKSPAAEGVVARALSFGASAIEASTSLAAITNSPKNNGL